MKKLVFFTTVAAPYQVRFIPHLRKSRPRSPSWALARLLSSWITLRAGMSLARCTRAVTSCTFRPNTATATIRFANALSRGWGAWSVIESWATVRKLRRNGAWGSSFRLTTSNLSRRSAGTSSIPRCSPSPRERAGRRFTRGACRGRRISTRRFLTSD